MVTTKTNLDRLTLLVERLQDAELLPDAEGAELFTRTEAARQSLEAGDIQAARRHIEQIVHFLEALVQTNRLTLSDGRAVTQAANDILNPPPDSGDPAR
jgi:hypothetical protein